LEKKSGSTLHVAYISMEFYEGGDLLNLLVGKGGFSEEIARFFFKQMLSGMIHCHRNGIVHRDLKPDNMMLA